MSSDGPPVLQALSRIDIATRACGMRRQLPVMNGVPPHPGRACGPVKVVQQNPNIRDDSSDGKRTRDALARVADVEQRKSNEMIGAELGYRYVDSPIATGHQRR